MEKNLTTGSVFKNVILFSLPYLLSYFLQTLYGMADLFIIGQFEGVASTTAVSIGSQVMHMLTVMIVGLAMGTTVSIGQAIGAGDRKQAAKGVGNTVTLFMAVSVTLMAVLLVLVRPIVAAMSTPTEAVDGTAAYLTICFIGIPFITAYNIISSIFRGMGDSKSPMYFIAVACAANIGLDYLFMGVLHLGPAGAALGTTLSQAISVIVSLIVILKRKSIVLEKSDFKPRRPVMGKILKIGVPIALQDGLIQIAFIVITIIANHRGLNDAAAVGIVLLLLLIIKFKLHPVLSLLISALFIGLGAGMPVPTLVSTVEKGAGETLQGIVLLIGLGSLFGGILEISGGAQCVAHTLVNKFGEKKAGVALGITGLVVGTTVFFEAGVVILIPLAFGLARKTKKSTLYYVIPLLAGLATGFAFIPPSAGSVLVANMLHVDLGVMIAVGVPVGILSLIFAGILWSKFIGKRINTGLPSNIQEVKEAEEKKLPSFATVLCIILVPLVLIVLSTVSEYISGNDVIRPVLQFLGTPFVALIIAVLFAMYFLGKKQGYNGEQLKKIMDRSLRPTGQILLVITGGGIIRWVLQNCGMGQIIGPALEKSGLPLVIVAFLIAALIRASVGAAVVAMTMAAGIMAAMPGVAQLSPIYLAAMVCAINGGATAFSHVNDSGFWLVSSLLEIDEKTTLKSWTIMETIIGVTGLVCAVVISLFA